MRKLATAFAILSGVPCLIAQVVVSPGSPTLNPTNVTVSYSIPEVGDVKLLIGRTTASPCVIGLQGSLIKLYTSVSAWIPATDGYIGSGLISTPACSINLATSTYSSTSGWVTGITTKLTIQVSGALSQANMDVTYLYNGYNENGELNQYYRTDAVGTWNVTGAPAEPGNLTFPTANMVLQTPNITFMWSPANFPANYELWLGTAQGASDILSSGITSQSQFAATGIPLGSTVHVTLRTHPIGGGAPMLRYYSFLTQGAPNAAQVISPVANSTLSAPVATFQWTAGQGALLYRLMVGTSAGTGDILDQLTTGLSLSTAIPATGQLVHVTLTTHTSSSQQSRSYTYRAASAASPPRPAAITNPAAGTVLPAGGVVFTWDTGVGVQSYRLDVGTVAEGANLYSASLTGTSAVVTNIPQTGAPVYVTLWSRMGTTLSKNSYVYLAPAAPAAPPPVPQPGTIVSPVANSVLSDSTATFQWNTGQGADAYQLCVGNSPLGCSLFQGPVTWSNTQTVYGLPTNGATLYTTLWSRINLVWYNTTVTVTAGGAQPPPFGPPWTISLMDGPGTFTFREFKEGYLSIVPFYEEWTNGATTGPNCLILNCGMFSTQARNLPQDLITPRGRRYSYGFSDASNPPVTSTMYLGQPASAADGGAECFKRFNAPQVSYEGFPCLELNDLTQGPDYVAQRDPQQSVRSHPSRVISGFLTRAWFQDLGNPLPSLQPAEINGVTYPIPDLFNAFQSVFVHKQPNYQGGNEYGFQYEARHGNLSFYAAINANVEATQRGFGRALNELIPGIQGDLMLGERYFAAWVARDVTQTQQRVLCFQVGKPLPSGVRLALSPAWCYNTQQILQEPSSSFGWTGAFDANGKMIINQTVAQAQVNAFLVEMESAQGYVTGTNIYFVQGVKKLGYVAGDPGQPSSFVSGAPEKWRDYWTFPYDMPQSFRLRIAELKATP